MGCLRRSRGSTGPSLGAETKASPRATNSFVFIELQRSGIDTIAEMSRLRSVIEDVTEMRAAFAARDFNSPHHEAIIVFGFDIFFGNGSPKARPAGAGIELGIGREKLIATAGASIHSLFVMIPIFAGEGSFGALLSADGVLLGCQLLLPLIFAFFDLFHL